MASSRSRGQVFAVVALLAIVVFARAAEAQSPPLGAALVGKKFTIDNVTPFNGIPPCPSANPNTVTFYAGQDYKGTVVIVGEWDAASIGVCTGSVYAVPPGTTVQYELYSDWIVFRVEGRVGSALKLTRGKSNTFTTIGIGNDFPVSILTEVGKA